MGIDSKHPRWLVLYPDWQKMRDTYSGAQTVKSRNETYLPMTQGMVEQGEQGLRRYNAYKGRAHFSPVVRDAIEMHIGVMHHKPPKISLPARMEPLRERATPHGESLEMLLRRVNEEQLITGRAGLLVDVAPRAELPHLVFYQGESIINWDDGARDDPAVTQVLNLVVLQESEFERILEQKKLFCAFFDFFFLIHK